MHPLIQEKRADIAALCRRYRVRHLEVFGSAARGDDFDPASSDADFLVEFEPQSNLPPLEEFFGFQAELSRLLDRPMDLVEARAVRNPYVLANIIARGNSFMQHDARAYLWDLRKAAHAILSWRAAPALR